MKSFKTTLSKTGLAALAVFIVFTLSPVTRATTGIGAGGIPGLILTTDMITNFSDFTAAYLNPALLTGVDQAEVVGGAKRWNAGSVGILNPKYGTIAVPFLLNHTAAVTLMEMGLSGVEKTNNRGEKLPGFISSAEYVVQGSYGYKILPYLSLGSNATVIIPQVDQEGELGVTFDLGLRWHPIEDYLLGHFSAGVNLQNIFYKDFGRSLGDEFNKYPFNVHLQAHWFNEYYRPFLERFEVSFNMAIMDLITEAQNFGDPENTISIANAAASTQALWNEQRNKFKGISMIYGLHAKWFPFKFFGIRSGINTDGVVPFGISLNWKNINVLRRVQLDYDFGVSLEDSLASDSRYAHIFKLSVRFGPTREEAVSERWYRQLVKEPQNDFNEAMRLYLAKKYWLASFAFGKVLAKWPSFSKVDVATFYMGKSYEYLHMYDVARETYTKGLKKYTTSDLRPKFIFQIQNLDYKTGNYESALKNYGFIMNLYRDSDVSPDADYVAGQIYYNKNDLESAINVLNSIAPDNENYPYAQYTLAMINVRRKNYDGAIEHLNAVVSIDTSRTVSEKSLKEMAFVRLGFLFFEQGDLKNAYGAFKRVPAESRFYDEALLGLAWAMVRGGVDQSYLQAIKFADNLVSTRPKSVNVAEAYLVIGYAYTLLKDYGKAVNGYKKTIELCDAKYISREEFKARETQNQTFMGGYNEFQRKALGIALRKPTPVLEQQKSEMTPSWEKYDGEIRNFDIYKIEAEMQFAFKKSSVKLKKDAEYALATTLHLMDSEKKVKILQETGDKSKAIDQKMNDLQNQLKELEEK